MCIRDRCKAVSEPDENGQWETAGGTYGNISEGYVTAIWVNGAGVRTVEKGAEPYSLTLNVKSDRSVAALNKAVSYTHLFQTAYFPNETQMPPFQRQRHAGSV